MAMSSGSGAFLAGTPTPAGGLCGPRLASGAVAAAPSIAPPVAPVVLVPPAGVGRAAGLDVIAGVGLVAAVEVGLVAEAAASDGAVPWLTTLVVVVLGMAPKDTGTAGLGVDVAAGPLARFAGATDGVLLILVRVGGAEDAGPRFSAWPLLVTVAGAAFLALVVPPVETRMESASKRDSRNCTRSSCKIRVI